jgi:arginase
MKQDIVFIGTGSGWGARDMGTGKGPHNLLNSVDPETSSKQIFSSFSPYNVLLKNFHDFENFTPLFPLDKEASLIRKSYVKQALTHHYEAMKTVLAKKLFPIVIGGDHSLAIATWSAVKHHHGVFGLIWLDAHLDAHTSSTTPSNAIHGMPVAHLLGYGDADLATFGDRRPIILPQNLVYIGARSFEFEEKELLTRLGVKIYFMDEVNARGFSTVFQEAKEMVTKNTPYYGISLDIDAFDPIEVPGTGAKEPKGLKETEVFPNFYNLRQDPHLICFEIVEFNPDLDKGEKTLSFLWRLTKTFLGQSLHHE